MSRDERIALTKEAGLSPFEQAAAELRAEIDKERRMYAALSELSSNENSWAKRFRIERDEARAEVERLRADAERYRWLRDIDTGPAQIWELISDDAQPPYMTLKSGNILDAAIDAARAALKEAK